MANLSVEPQSKIWLTKCALESDLKNTFTFNTHQDQLNYFNNLSATELLANDYTYIRKDNKIRANINYDQAVYFNYLYYLNDGFTGRKSYFCFIDRCEYVNENCTDIYFHTDVFQTWYFQLRWNRCFIEREHVNDDTIGANTIPENLETGEPINIAEPVNLNNWNDEMVICVCVSDFPRTMNSHGKQDALALSMSVNSMYSGVYYCMFQASAGWDTTCDWATEFLNMYDQDAKSNAVVSVFVVPRAFHFTEGSGVHQIQYVSDTSDHIFYLPIKSTGATTLVSSASVTRPSNQGGSYSPKNNKLKVYPYMYMDVTNNAGTDVIMNYEDFSSTPSFKIIGSLSPGCSIKCIPLNYKKLNEGTDTIKSFNYGIAGCKLPICNWNTDTYTNWLTENGVNLALGRLGGASLIAIAGGLALTGVGAGASVGLAVSGVSMIANSMASNYQHSLAPDQAKGNTSVGDVTYSAGKSIFTVHRMGIREEYARSIDEYFSMFGYKVNRVKTPNITGRSQWNYVKTIDCNVEGDIPQEDLETIRKAMNSGVTFWHTPANIYNYSLSNNIV